jgi:hypothetical protein
MLSKALIELNGDLAGEGGPSSRDGVSDTQETRQVLCNMVLLC